MNHDEDLTVFIDLDTINEMESWMLEDDDSGHLKVSGPNAKPIFAGKKSSTSPSVSVDVIKTWWSELGYRCSDLNNEALYYFEQTCNEIPTVKIFSTFSRDGVEKIPQLFSLLDREKALEASKKIFNKLLELRQKK